MEHPDVLALINDMEVSVRYTLIPPGTEKVDVPAQPVGDERNILRLVCCKLLCGGRTFHVRDGRG